MATSFHARTLRFRTVSVASALFLAAALLATGLPSPAEAEDDPPARYAGANRFETAASMAGDQVFGPFPAEDVTDVIVAAAFNFPDGLAAAGAAGLLGPTPVLLVNDAADTPTDVTLATLERLQPDTVHIAGGPAAVSASIAAAIDTAGSWSVNRFAGRNRYDTARLLATQGTYTPETVGQLEGRSTAIVARAEPGGFDVFADSLAAGPFAYHGRHPVLLTHPLRLAPETIEALEDLSIEQVVLMGGPAAVSEAVEDELEALTGNPPIRVFEPDGNRYGTAAAMADRMREAFGDFPHRFALLASGQEFADALAAGPFLGQLPGPLLITPKDRLAPETAGWLERNADVIDQVIGVGGPAAVNQDVLDAAREAVGDDPRAGLRLGYLLPETGPLAFLGPAQIKAVEMAVAEINEAGGVLGQEVFLTGADEAGDAAVADASVDRLLAENVHTIIGAAATSMSLAVIDKIVGAGVLQCSASNLAPTFTDYDDDGLYFRTVPSDAFQGPVLAQTVISDGYSRVALLGRADDYGQALVDGAEAVLEEAGADIVAKVAFDPDASSFSPAAEEVAAADPDAVIIVAFDEVVQLLQHLSASGLSAQEAGLYATASNRVDDLNERVGPGDPNVIDGFRGVAPEFLPDEAWNDRFEEFSGVTEPFFSANAYDCTVLAALAAQAAAQSDGRAMAAEMIDLTRGEHDCEGFAACAELLAAGESVKYHAASRGFDQLTDAGEPNGGLYEIWAWEDGELVTIDQVESFLD